MAVWAGEKEGKTCLNVKGMTCGHCVDRVKTALEKVEGVKTADVQLKEGHADVRTIKQVKFESLAKAVHEAGFEASSTETCVEKKDKK
ncbi:MAG: heavy-metal-associated domain-containing protein [Acidobacteria bacterium]|nr:heavy-metal-associated domain-containing protein [Acidobacteriota bacterium]